MTTMPTLSLVIPCLNEMESIDSVLNDLRTLREDLQKKALANLQILVVDDGSSDGSKEILESQKDIVLISRPANRGYGSSLKEGFLHAQGDYIGFLDMDRTYPAPYFTELLLPCLQNQCDISWGDRLSHRTEMPLLRQIGNRIYRILIRILLQRGISDACSGMRVFPRHWVKEFTALPEDGLNYSIALTLFCLNLGLRVREVPIPYSDRSGRSKLNPFTDGFRFLCTILQQWWFNKLKSTPFY